MSGRISYTLWIVRFIILIFFLLENNRKFSIAVIGDGGRLYVAPDVVPVYRSMLPLADVITPNYFEVE